MLVNNSYSNTRIDELINVFLCNIKQNKENILHNDTIPIYYKNQMHRNYKNVERIIKELINKNLKPIDDNNKLKIIIY